MTEPLPGDLALIRSVLTRLFDTRETASRLVELPAALLPAPGAGAADVPVWLEPDGTAIVLDVAATARVQAAQARAARLQKWLFGVGCLVLVALPGLYPWVSGSPNPAADASNVIYTLLIFGALNWAFGRYLERRYWRAVLDPAWPRVSLPDWLADAVRLYDSLRTDAARRKLTKIDSFEIVERWRRSEGATRKA